MFIGLFTKDHLWLYFCSTIEPKCPRINQNQPEPDWRHEYKSQLQTSWIRQEDYFKILIKYSLSKFGFYKKNPYILFHRLELF